MLISTSKIHEEFYANLSIVWGKKTLNFYWKFYFIFHSLRFLCKHIHEVILHLICPKPMIFLSCRLLTQFFLIALLLPLCQQFRQKCHCRMWYMGQSGAASEKERVSEWAKLRQSLLTRAKNRETADRRRNIDTRIMAFCRWCWYTSACSEYIEWFEYFIGEETYYSDFGKTESENGIRDGWIEVSAREIETIDQIMYSNIPLNSLNCIGRKSVHRTQPTSKWQKCAESIQSDRVNHSKILYDFIISGISTEKDNKHYNFDVVLIFFCWTFFFALPAIFRRVRNIYIFYCRRNKSKY